MIRGGFLSTDDRRALTGLARDGLAEDRVARRANANVLIDQGGSCERVAASPEIASQELDALFVDIGGANLLLI